MDEDEDQQFGAVVGTSYGLAEAQMGRELYEATMTNTAGVTEYWKAKANFWNAVAVFIALAAIVGVVAGATAIVKWWF
jgi:hypothetical protein